MHCQGKRNKNTHTTTTKFIENDYNVVTGLEFYKNVKRSVRVQRTRERNTHIY